MKKNIENSDMPSSRPTRLAPRRVRRRKIENGHQRVALAALDDQERDQQDHGGADLEQGPRGSPADVDGVDDRVDEQ
jgi:hypothetical protein